MSTARQSTRLYTPAILGLSASLALYPFDEDFERRASARSPVCGSHVTIGLDLAQGEGRSEEERVSRIGIQLSACAIGQASAAILAGAIIGMPRSRIEAALDATGRWLTQGGGLPDWPGMGAIEPAREHAGRHGALLLPWRAASLALSSPGSAR